MLGDVPGRLRVAHLNEVELVPGCTWLGFGVGLGLGVGVGVAAVPKLLDACRESAAPSERRDPCVPRARLGHPTCRESEPTPGL